MKKVFFLFLSITLIISYKVSSQVAINTDGTDPDGSAMLDVKSANKGLLLPNVALTGTTDATTITSPAVSLLVYNTSAVSDVTPGYYYNSGTTGAPVWASFVTTTTTLAIGNYYQGGIIFHLDETGQHGLIAATADQSTGVLWDPFASVMTGAAKLYDGKFNTDRIIAVIGSQAFAAMNCSNYTGGGFLDWYLPSTGELVFLYNQKTTVGGFTNNVYWSSSESGSSNAYGRSFDTGAQINASKDVMYYTRAIRAF